MDATTTTDQFTPVQRKIIARVEADLLSGRYFTLAAASQSSRDRLSYHGPLAPRAYAAVLTALGAWAAQGDRSAATAAAIAPKVNLYGTEPMLLARVATVLAEIARDGYYDVVGATGPEAGRPSDHQHATTLRSALLLAVLYDEIEAAVGGYGSGHAASIGWVLDHLLTREGVTVYAAHAPRVAKALAR